MNDPERDPWPSVEEPDDRHDCDELCRCCSECYVADGAEICSKLCKHSTLVELDVMAGER
jgi:hypothetical protein